MDKFGADVKSARLTFPAGDWHETRHCRLEGEFGYKWSDMCVRGLGCAFTWVTQHTYFNHRFARSLYLFINNSNIIKNNKPFSPF